jgi:hypothetical protein
VNRWIVAALLFTLGTIVGISLYRLDVRSSCRAYAHYAPTTGLKAAVEAIRPRADAEIRLTTHDGFVVIESSPLVDRAAARRRVATLSEAIAARSSTRSDSIAFETEEHPDADGLAVGCITGYAAALAWIRFAPRQRRELPL